MNYKQGNLHFFSTVVCKLMFEHSVSNLKPCGVLELSGDICKCTYKDLWLKSKL